MKTAGLVYVLINPSMQGLLKIGKTERSSEKRARELSVATGVPTPFIVAFEEDFDDCIAAERLVHALLEERGCRVSPNREFFSLELKEAVRAVSDAKDILGRQSIGRPQPSGAVVPTHTDLQSMVEILRRKDSGEISGVESARLMRQFRDPEAIDPWQEVLDHANDAYHGSGESFQDYEEAFRLYKRAASLGATSAYWHLAFMCMDGEGCSKDQGQAVKFLRTGAERGDLQAQLWLAEYYLDNGEPVNASRCWGMYIRWGIADSEEHLALGLKFHMWMSVVVNKYFPEVQSGRVPLICADLLARYKEDLVAALEWCEMYDAQQNNDKPDGREELGLKVESDMKLRRAAAWEVIAALPNV